MAHTGDFADNPQSIETRLMISQTHDGGGRWCLFSWVFTDFSF